MLRPLAAVGVGLALVALSGCSSETQGQAARFGLVEGASDRAGHMGSLWTGAWIAALIVGVFVWGLIIFVVVRFRRRSSDPEIPRQSRYHLPLEVIYTLVPFLIIGVLFFYTVRTQDKVLARDAEPQHVINVVGQKWSWTFNYMEAGNPDAGSVVTHESGTIEKIPDLYLPVNQSVRVHLNSADVIHSFWVPAFYFKMDVIPGHPNQFDLTPTRVGVYDGKCAEFCGTYHANMLFKVHVVPVAEYNAHLQQLKASGQTGEVKPPSSVKALAGTSQEGSEGK
ncbi:aa3-type cytochrome oxidase subunit II [Acidipropionibacterium jensenii]|uniref:aa3-type cytochrome oxidase subunit II n=1 Tax=Acidipropionibacterium jensenii TaxID=1749 RepID=UPI00403CE57C